MPYLDKDTVDIEVLQDENATVARVTMYAWSNLNARREKLQATGSAKRHPDDKHSAALGRKLAIARALHSLSQAVYPE